LDIIWAGNRRGKDKWGWRSRTASSVVAAQIEPGSDLCRLARRHTNEKGRIVAFLGRFAEPVGKIWLIFIFLVYL
jgi:hypothetical protein